MCEEADDPRRDDGSSSSEPESCAEADRKARRASWRFLIKAHLGTHLLTYVSLQRVVAFYSRHPELRRELATEEGLMRVQGLTGPASVTPLEY